MRRASPFRSRAGKQIGDACKEVGATFCLDGVASGTAWIDMDYANIGAYITAPQKGWSGPAAVGVCMLAVHKSNFAALLLDGGIRLTD